MLPNERQKRLVSTGILLGALTMGHQSLAQWMISGNEAKIDLDSGAPLVVNAPQKDSVTLMDFSVFPPLVQHFFDISNSVIGPPSNIAITPDGRRVLIADSLRLDSDAEAGWVPASRAHVFSLGKEGLKPLGEVKTGSQPSGISISPDGHHAFIANRADGTLTWLDLRGDIVSNGAIKVCEPEDSLSDVAISPDGSTLLASVQKGGYLAELRLEGNQVTLTGRRYSVYGQPYRVVISPDGRFGITAGAGSGDPLDPDALTLVDLKAEVPRVVDHITIDPVTESLEISPDGKWIAAVCMAGSNLAADDPHRSEHGSLVILKRDRHGFEVKQRLPTGRIPEGVAFTSDSRTIAVQCHPSKEIWIYQVKRGKVVDTGHRIVTPGFPSSLRAVIR